MAKVPETEGDRLVIRNVEFIGGMAERHGWRPESALPEIAFAGRSNVGKSTLLNALTRTQLARTSAAPGKTRLANIYRITVEGGPGGSGRWSVYFVDLPGYGYARGGSDAAAELAAVAAAYYQSGSGVRGRSASPDHGSRITDPGGGRAPRATLHLIDARHPALQSDIEAARWFDSVGVDRHVVATKIDKLNRSERNRNLKELERIFERPALPLSATSGEGLDELWRLIARAAREQRP